jgi:predicted protein tyrosine phosphatase
MTKMQLMDNGLPLNLHNEWQGKFKRVLCVCTGGILRSATTAEILSREPYHCNTRACGLREDLSLVPISDRLIEWADEIVCFEQWHMEVLRTMTDKPIYCLNIDDAYPFRGATLVRLIRERIATSKFNKTRPCIGCGTEIVAGNKCTFCGYENVLL